jgi:hypothetical protein
MPPSTASSATQSRFIAYFWVMLFSAAVVALGVNDLQKRGFSFARQRGQSMSAEQAAELVRAMHGSLDPQSIVDEKEQASPSRGQDSGDSKRGWKSYLKRFIPL